MNSQKIKIAIVNGSFIILFFLWYYVSHATVLSYTVTDTFTSYTNGDIVAINNGNISTSWTDDFEYHPIGATSTDIITMVFPNSVDISSVDFYNRTSCCQDRIDGADMIFKNANGIVLYTYTFASSWNLVTITDSSWDILGVKTVELTNFQHSSQNFREIVFNTSVPPVIPSTPQSPVTESVISIELDWIDPFDWSDGDGNDSSATNELVRNFDFVGYNVEVSLNDADDTNVIATIHLNDKAKWSELPSECKTQVDFPWISPDSSINDTTGDGLNDTMICNFGNHKEWTKLFVKPFAQAIWGNTDIIEASVISSSDNNINLSGFSGTQGEESIQTEITAWFWININKSVLWLLSEDEIFYTPVLYPQDAIFAGSPQGKVIEWYISLWYDSGSEFVADNGLWTQSFTLTDTWVGTHSLSDPSIEWDNINNDFDDQIIMLGTLSGIATDNCALISTWGGNVTCSQDGPGQPITISLSDIPVNQQQLANISLKMFVPFPDVFQSPVSETYNIENNIELTSWGGGWSLIRSTSWAVDSWTQVSSEDFLVNDTNFWIITFHKTFDILVWNKSGQRAAARWETIETTIGITDIRQFNTKSAICDTIDTNSFEFIGHIWAGQKDWVFHGVAHPVYGWHNGISSPVHFIANPSVVVANRAINAGPIFDPSSNLMFDGLSNGITIEYSSVDYSTTGDDHFTATCEDDLTWDGNSDWVDDFNLFPGQGSDVVRVRMTFDRDIDQIWKGAESISTAWFSFDLKIKDTVVIGEYLPNTAATFDRDHAFWLGNWGDTTSSTRPSNGTAFSNVYISVEDDPSNALYSFNSFNADRVLVLPASMAISKVSNEPSAVEPGDIVSFTIDPRTSGSNANNVTMTFTDTLPGELSYISDTCAMEYAEVWLSCLVSVSWRTITWTVSDYQIGDNLPEFDLFTAVNYGTLSGVYTNRVEIDSDFSTFSDDSYCDTSVNANGISNTLRCQLALSNAHRDTASIIVISGSGYRVEKEIDQLVTEPNADFKNTLRYINIGSSTIGEWHIIDVLPYNWDGHHNTMRFNANVSINANTATQINGINAKFVSVTWMNGETFEYSTDPHASIDLRPCHPSNWPVWDSLWSGNTSLDAICSKGLIDPATDVPTLFETWTSTTNWGALPTDASTVTAFRAFTSSFSGSSPVRELLLTMNTWPALENDLFCNNFGSNSDVVTLDILSNDVCIPVVSGTIWDTVWYDEDANWVQNWSEIWLANLTLALLNAWWVPIYIDPITRWIVDASYPWAIPYITITDVNGSYLFENLPSGDFQIQVIVNTLPNGMVQTFDSNGIWSLNISNHTLLQEFDALGNLLDIEDNTDQDFGYTAFVDLEVTKLVDVDGDDSYTNFEIMNVPGLNGNPDPTVFNYQITLENTSNLVEGTNVTLTDIIPPGVTVTASDATPNEALPLTWTAATGTPISWDFPVVTTGASIIITLDVELTSANVTDFQGWFDSGKSTQNVAQVTAMEETDIDSLPDNGDDADFGWPTSGFDWSTSEDDEDDARIGIPPAIGNYVWLDANNNGIQDASEEGIEGVVVNLYAAATDTIIATVTTNSDGGYFFTDLEDGVPYYVWFDHTSAVAVNFNPSEQDSTGSTDDLDSDGDVITGFTESYTLSPGEIYSDFDQWYVPIMSIWNRVFEDTDANGSMWPDELGIVWVTVELRDANGDSFSTPITTVTDADGYYLFTDLTPGDYTVFIPQQTVIENHLSSPWNPNPENGVDNDDNGWEVVVWDPSAGYITGVINLTANGEWEGEIGGTGTQIDNANDINSNMTVDFGFFPPVLPTIVKDFSVNIVSPNEVSRLTLTLWNTNAFDIFLSADFTDTLPTWIVLASSPNIQTTCPATPVADGGSSTITYTAGSILPLGWCTIMVDVIGDANGEYINLIGTGALQTNIWNSPESTTDFIRILSGSIWDYVWNDENRDGIQNVDEEGFVWVELFLLDESGVVIATAITDANGEYLFDWLPLGRYIVVVDSATLPANNFQTFDVDGIEESPHSSIHILEVVNNEAGELIGVEENSNQDFGYYIWVSSWKLEKSSSSVPMEQGDTLDYVFTLENDGDLDISAISLIDEKCSVWPTLDATTDTWSTSILSAGETWTYTCTSIGVTQQEADDGEVYNQATVTGTPAWWDLEDLTADVTRPVWPTPSLQLFKSGEFFWTQSPRIWSLVDYTFVVTNTGNVTISNVVVTDPQVWGDITSSCEFPTDSITGLLPEETATCEARYQVTGEDSAQWYVENTATVSGTSPQWADVLDISDDGDDTVETANGEGVTDNDPTNDPTVLLVPETVISGGSGWWWGGWSSSRSTPTLAEAAEEEEEEIIEEEFIEETPVEEETVAEVIEETIVEETIVEEETQEEEVVETERPITPLPSLPVPTPIEKKVPVEYVPYPNQFTFPTILPQTGTSLEEKGVRIIQNPKIDLVPPSWAQPWASEDPYKWISEVLPYSEDRNEDEYIVIPTLWVVVPLSYVPQWSEDYLDIVTDGTQIKDFSLSWGKNYLEYLNEWVMQYPGTLPAGLSAWDNKEYTGNTVIFGHSSYWKSNEGKYDTIFGLLPTLDEWEEIWLFTRKNTSTATKKWEYQLRKHIIEKSYNTSPNDTEILTQEWYTTPHLTLFTCTPIWGISGRWIVNAKLTEVTSMSQKAWETEEARLRQTQIAKDLYNLPTETRDRIELLVGRVFETTEESRKEDVRNLILLRVSNMRDANPYNYRVLKILDYFEEAMLFND